MNDFTKATGPGDIRPVHEAFARSAQDNAVAAINALQERRRAQVSRVNDQGVALTEIAGVISVSGAGELSREVPFSVMFVDRPSISCGWELPEGADPAPGSFPMVSAGVFKWIRRDMGQQRNYYVGAQIGVRIEAAEHQALIVHWQMTGKAFRNPIGISDTI